LRSWSDTSAIALFPKQFYIDKAMKLKAIPIATIIFSLWFAIPAAALPLQVGIYRDGSRYIQIAQKGRRLCYRGFSINGVTTASITPDAKNPGFYLIHGFKDVVLSQQELNTLLFGELNNLLPYEADPEFPHDISPDLQRCLNSKKPFFKQVIETRRNGN
jgi:hypothetical protein